MAPRSHRPSSWLPLSVLPILVLATGPPDGIALGPSSGHSSLPLFYHLSNDSLFPSLEFYPLSTLLWLFRPNSSSLLMSLCGHEIIVFYMDFNECTLHKKEMLLLQSGLFLHLK